MTDPDDLIERLIKARESLSANGVTIREWDGSLYVEAAAALREQRDEIARLQTNQRCSAIEQGEVGYPCVYRAEIEAALREQQVDIARLKAENKELLDHDRNAEMAAIARAERAEARVVILEKANGVTAKSQIAAHITNAIEQTRRAERAEAERDACERRYRERSSAIHTLMDERNAAQHDAKRYRWMRENPLKIPVGLYAPWSGQDLDDVIDFAMKGKP